MARIAVLGAGLGGVIMAYELGDLLGKEHKIAVLTKGTTYSVVPSNPWVAVSWRDRETIEADLVPVFARRDIHLLPQAPPACTRPRTASN